MAFDVSSLTNYVDESSTELLLAATLGSTTASKVGAQTGIKSSKALQILDTDVVFQADACSFSSDGATPFTQRVLTVGAVMVNEALCPKDLESKWTQLLLTPGCDMSEADIPEAYMTQKVAKIQEALEIADWQGNLATGTGNNSFYDGFISIIDGAAGTVNGNTAAITVGVGITQANIIGILQDIYKAIPAEVVGKEDMSIWVGSDVMRLYICALIDANLFHYAADGVTMLHGTNIAIEVANGLNGTDRIFAAAKSNMFVGHDLESDAEDFDLFYAREAKQVRFDACFKRGTQIAHPGEVVEFELV